MPRKSKFKAQSEPINELTQELIDNVQEPSSSASANEEENSMIENNNKECNNINNIRNSFLINKTQQLEKNNATNNNQKDEAAYFEEILNSQRCRDFDDYLNFNPKGDSDSCDFFVDATNNEVKYFARKFIEFVISKPKEIKEFGAVAAKFKTILLSVRKFIAEVVRNLENEFRVMKQKKPKSIKNLDNFAKFLGELYVSQSQIIDTKFMTEFLNYLKDKNQFITLTSTLKVCGYYHKLRNYRHFNDLIKSVAFGPIVGDEITKLSENFDDKRNIFTSRLFKPSENAESGENLEEVLTEIAESKNVNFDFVIYRMTNINTRKLVTIIADILQKSDANVVEVAKFLKTLYDFASKITNFIHNIKENLRSKILNMSDNNPQEMRILGKFTAELRNLSVTNDETQKLWLEKIETFDLDKSFEVIEVYVDVVKAMLVEMQTFQLEKLQSIHKNLKITYKTLESSTSASAARIKSKIAKNFFNKIILKAVTPSTSELLFKIRLGHKIDGLPHDMPEKNPNILDVRDFGRILCIAAVSNHHFTANFVKSIKVLKAGPNGEIFIQTFRDEITSNLLPSVFKRDFCGSDDAVGTFELIFHLFMQEFLTELEMTSFLEKLLVVKNFKDYQDCASELMDILQLYIVSQTRKNPEKFSKHFENCVKNVQRKLKQLDDKRMMFSKLRGSKSTKNSAACQSQSAESPQNLQNIPKVTSAAKKIKKKSKRSKNIEAKKTQLLSKNQQEVTEEPQPSTDPSDEASHVFFPIIQKIQTPYSSICHLVKNIELDPEYINEDSLLYDQLYPEEQPTHKQQAVKGSRSLMVRLNSADLIHQNLLSNTDKIAKESIKILPVLTPAQSISQTDPEIQEFCNKILLKMTASTKDFKKHAITIYYWNMDNSDIRSKEKELIELLTKELQKNHKQLLAKVSNELTDEYDVLRKGQTAKQKTMKISACRNSFILTFKAVALLLLKSQIYDNLDCMLNHIRDGNKIALELFIDVVENLKDTFKENSKERDSFVTNCINVLEYAASFKNIDEVTLGRVLKMTQFLKSLNIQYEILPNQMVYTNPGSNAFESALFKKPKKSKKTKQKNQKVDSHSSQSGVSNQSNGKSIQVTGKSSQSNGKSIQVIGKSSEQSSKINTKSSGQSSKVTKNSNKQSSLVIDKAIKEPSQIYGKSSVPLSQVIKDSNENSWQVVLKSNEQSDKVDESSSSQLSQIAGKSTAQSCQVGEKSNSQLNQISGKSREQSCQLDEKLFIDEQIIIEDPPASLKSDNQVKFYLNQLHKSNINQMVNKIYPFLNKNFPKLKFLDFLIQMAILNQKNIEPVVELFQFIYGTKCSRKDKRLITEEVFKEFISLCRNGVNLEEKVMNFEKFTVAFELNFQGPFWYQLWGKLFDLIKQGYPNSLNILVLLMHAKIEEFKSVQDFKKLMKNISNLLSQKLVLVRDENLRDKMNKIIATLELATVEIQNKKMKKIVENCQKSNLNDTSPLKIQQLENENPNWIALQKQMKYRPRES